MTAPDQDYNTDPQHQKSMVKMIPAAGIEYLFTIIVHDAFQRMRTERPNSHC